MSSTMSPFLATRLSRSEMLSSQFSSHDASSSSQPMVDSDLKTLFWQYFVIVQLLKLDNFGFTFETSLTFI